jgi:integrase
MLVKAIEQNLYLHENGHYYALWTVNGKTERQSLKTSNLKVARRQLKHLLAPTGSVVAAPKIEAVPNEGLHKTRPDFLKAVADHHANTPFESPATEKNFLTRQRTFLSLCHDWGEYNPVQLWKTYTAKGFVSAPNQLRWFLRSFTEYCIEKEWLDESFLKSVGKIPLKHVNPRRVEVPLPEQTSDLLRMCEHENKELGTFVRFLAVTGLRKSGGNGLKWEEVDFTHAQFRRIMKGGAEEVFPMIPEAVELLKARHLAQGQPSTGPVWGLSDRKLRQASRILKKYAKGLGLGLQYFHALRHHFASIALEAGLTPVEVAKLLGHKDGGRLVLTVYGHVIERKLKEKTDNLRILA